jgi:hypothetical protein
MTGTQKGGKSYRREIFEIQPISIRGSIVCKPEKTPQKQM